MIRQTQIRFAPVVSSDGTATVQMSFQAQTPHGVKTVTSGGKTLNCPNDVTVSQIVRFTMPVNGSAKTLTLNDGTEVTVSARR
jgi:chitodextrinase